MFGWSLTYCNQPDNSKNPTGKVLFVLNGNIVDAYSGHQHGKWHNQEKSFHVSRETWQVVLSCWNHLFTRAIFSNWVNNNCGTVTKRSAIFCMNLTWLVFNEKWFNDSTKLQWVPNSDRFVTHFSPQRSLMISYVPNAAIFEMQMSLVSEDEFVHKIGNYILLHNDLISEPFPLCLLGW